MNSLNYNSVSNLAKCHGNAFYYYHGDALQRNMQSIKEAVNEFYSNFNIGYSVKTNFVPEILKDAYGFGAFAEVVSPMELNIARKIGASFDRIIYNGPIKDRESVYLCIKNNSIINIDHFDEYKLIEDILVQHSDLNARIGIRINLPLSDGFSSRFGFETSSSELKNVLEAIALNERIELVGIHHHSTRNDKSLDSYAERIRSCHAFYMDNAEIFNLEYIDIGGGFYGPMDDGIKEQFDDYIPSLQEYGSLLGKQMKSLFPNSDVKLIVEPGLAMVVNALDFYCEVEYTKVVGERHIAGMSGSFFNVKPTGHKKHLTAEIISQDVSSYDAETNEFVLAGFTCLENDIMHERFEGAVNKGDFIVFKNVGAYTLVFNPLFIKSAPAIISDEGKRVLKDSELFDNTFSSYKF